LDIGLLLAHRDVFDVFSAFEYDHEEDDIEDRRELEVAMIDMIAFVYGLSESTNTYFDQMVESGVHEAYAQHHPDRVLRGVDLEIDDARREMLLETAWDRWQCDEPLSPQGAAALMQSVEFDDDDLPELRDRIRRHQEGGSALKKERQAPTRAEIASPPWEDTDSEDIDLPDSGKITDALENAPTLDELEEDPPKSVEHILPAEESASDELNADDDTDG
jgi:hypothetical protein